MMVIPEVSTNVLVSYLTGRDVLILSIIPMEGSILAYIVLIIAMTTISQLEGLAGYTPVRTPWEALSATVMLVTSCTGTRKTVSVR